MSITIADDDGTRYVFPDQTTAHTWMSEHMTKIQDVSKYILDNEITDGKHQEQKFELGTPASVLNVSTLVTGELYYVKDSNLIIKNVDVFLKDYGKSIATIIPVITENKATFEYRIDSIAKVGYYLISWNLEISGKPVIVNDKFTIYSDTIDRTLPMEMQYLK